MQIWQDVEKARYFALDTEIGKILACDKYGQYPKSFTPYCSGFHKSLTSREKTPDKNYRIQPRKFDGYFQCPRPALEVKYKQKTRLPDDINSLPRPVKSLQFSSMNDNSKPNSLSKIPQSKNFINELKTLTLKDYRLQLLPPVLREVKTAANLEEKLKNDNLVNRSFRKKEEKEERRKLKGYFMCHIPSNNDLFQKEKNLLVITNPVSHFKQKKFEELDRKYLEKRKNQKIIKEKYLSKK